jgi:CubicO group peptidase (beta-lactamase class C family)
MGNSFMADLSTAHDASIFARFPDLETVIAEVMAEWHIPGLALALIRRASPPLLRVFGLRDIENGTSVDTTTLFAIGSITKSFTATGLALLVDEGKLDWDVPVREILPNFRLKDPIATERCTVRDLLTHRTGLPRHDWVHTPGHLDKEGILAALRHLDPSKEFRSVYQYNNLMYFVAGMVAERVTGQRWEDFTQAHILNPLGMANTTTSLENMVAHYADHAAPHIFRDGALERMSVRPIHTRPSGAICASIADMASYLQFHLDPVARHAALQLSANAATQVTAPQVYVGRPDYPELGDVHYGLGFEVARYRGERTLAHGGGWSGYTSELRMLPDRGFGVAVLTNGHWHSGSWVVSHAIVDRLMGVDPLPWLDRLRTSSQAQQAQRPKDLAARAAARRPAAAPSRDLSHFAGDYEHPAYGVVHIFVDDGALRWHGLGLELPISHRHYDVFELGADWSIWFEDMTLQFQTDREGEIASLSIPLEPAVPPISFRRMPEPATTTRAYLEPLTGLYRRCGVPFHIALDDRGRLTMTRGSGKSEQLLPGHGGTFGLAGDHYFKLEFRRDASGSVDAMLFHEASGIYLVERVPAQPQ